MPRAIVEDNSRLAPRVRPDDKATLDARGGARVTHRHDRFHPAPCLDAARKVIEQAEHLTLSERDSLRVLDALENPPAPNAKLWRRRAACPRAHEVCRIGAKRRSRKARPRVLRLWRAELNEFLRRHARQSHEKGARNLRCRARR